MNIHELIELCRMYNDMGRAVQEQLERVLDNESLDDLNPNALLIIRSFFRECELDDVGGGLEFKDIIDEQLAKLRKGKSNG